MHANTKYICKVDDALLCSNAKYMLDATTQLLMVVGWQNGLSTINTAGNSWCVLKSKGTSCAHSIKL